MNINELFEEIQNKFFPDELNGEFQLHGNCIVWTYKLEDDSEEITIPADNEDEMSFGFDSTTPEELLNEAYEKDLELVEALLDEIEETENWTFSEAESSDTIISFKIF
jgi:hypothetical protein